MLDTSRLYLFILASLALLLSPGPAVLYIVTRSIDQGRKAGLVSVLGIETGNFVHVLAAALGLSAIILYSATLFTIIKYLGAAYLIYLGLRKLIQHADAQATPDLEGQNSRKLFSQGAMVAALNPKTALFFLAFLPQFVDRARGSVPLQMFILGAIFIAMACVTDSMYALMAGTARQWLRGSLFFKRGQRYATASIYIGLGMVAALAEKAGK
jgi:threonine/homoserine/homoserine lactone efflux protein